jgi:hypothetical protein
MFSPAAALAMRSKTHGIGRLGKPQTRVGREHAANKVGLDPLDRAVGKRVTTSSPLPPPEGTPAKSDRRSRSNPTRSKRDAVLIPINATSA